MYNTIISQQNGFVKPFALPSPIYVEEEVENVSKWEKRKLLSQKMARKMMKAGYNKRGLRMSACSTTMSFSKCDDCNHTQIHHASLCRDKLCPVCKWRLAVKRYKALSDILHIASDEYPEAVYMFVTLTVPNCKVNDLSSTLSSMSKQWNKLLQRVAMKRSRGWARATEITYNDKQRTVHPHYHVIVMFDGQSEADLYSMQIIKDWLDLNRNCSYKAQSVKTIAKKDLDSDIVKPALEVFKYSTKDDDLYDMPLNIFREFVSQISNKRMVSFGGWLKECKRLIEVDLETATEEPFATCQCCGSAALHDVLCEWSGVDNKYIKITI